MKRLIKLRVAEFQSKNRKNIWARKLDSIFIEMHKAYENLDYNFHRNGEAELLNKLKIEHNINVIFDVGANKGHWSSIASNLFPQATIFAFEIVPDTYASLLTTCTEQKNIVAQNIGLSDKTETTTVYYDAEKSTFATCVENFSENFHNYQPHKIEANVTTGDFFCSQNNIETIDFLKIDVEGYEHKVLKGFEGMLKKGRIKMIQFEYGYINIDTHFLLKDFYDFLGAFDMRIGKIYPSYVDFKDYKYSDENFYGPNYLAVHSSCKNIINSLC